MSNRYMSRIGSKQTTRCKFDIVLYLDLFRVRAYLKFKV